MKSIVLGLVLTASSMVAATITVVPSAQTTTTAQTISVGINISGVADLYAFQFDLSFAPGVLDAATVSDGGFLASGGFFPGFIDNALGTVTFIADSLIGPVAGKSGGGSLARIDFHAIAPGTSTLSISNVILLSSASDDITSAVQNGTVTVAGTPEPATGLLAGLTLLGIAYTNVRLRRG